jgi:hypothetical protein
MGASYPALFPFDLKPHPGLDKLGYAQFHPLGGFLASDQYDLSSQPGELPHELLTEPDVNLSAHPAPIVQPKASVPISNDRKVKGLLSQSYPTSTPPFWNDLLAFWIST